MSKKNPNVPITPEANLDLEIMIEESNSGFKAGKISKTDLVSFLITQFRKHYFKENLSELRAANFDETAFLASVLKERKNASKSGQTPPDLSKILKELADKKHRSDEPKEESI